MAVALLVERVRRPSFNPIEALTDQAPATSPIGACEALDRRKAGRLEVELKPVA